MADASVRPALPADAGAIARIQAATLPAALETGLGSRLPPELASRLRAEDFETAWHTAVSAPPTSLHRVLVALEGDHVVGFAALAPSPPPNPLPEPSAPAETRTSAEAALPAEAEIVALEVDPTHTRAGHGSRLLAACVDLLRRQNATRVQTWCVVGDEARTRFLTAAGFAPLAGVRRTYEVGPGQVSEAVWHTALGPPGT